MKGQTDSILLFHQQNVPRTKLEQVGYPQCSGKLKCQVCFKSVKPCRSKSVLHSEDNRCKVCGKVLLFSYFGLTYLFVPVSISSFCDYYIYIHAV